MSKYKKIKTLEEKSSDFLMIYFVVLTITIGITVERENRFDEVGMVILLLSAVWQWYLLFRYYWLRDEIKKQQNNKKK